MRRPHERTWWGSYKTYGKNRIWGYGMGISDPVHFFRSPFGSSLNSSANKRERDLGPRALEMAVLLDERVGILLLDEGKTISPPLFFSLPPSKCQKGFASLGLSSPPSSPPTWFFWRKSYTQRSFINITCLK